MSDINQSVPVRTDNPGEVQVKVVDNLIPSQGLTVNADGSVNVTDNGGSITVDATDLDIRDLAFATDKVDVTGSDVTVSNTVTVQATDLDIRDLDSATDSVEVLQATHDNLNVNANLQIGDADVTNLNPVPVSDAGGSLTVDATDLDIRDLSHTVDSVKIGDGTDLLEVNADGSINVRILDGTPGTSVCEYSTTAALAAGATATHTYTATGAFELKQIIASGSGSLKIVVKVNAVTKIVTFTSAAQRVSDVALVQEIAVASGQAVTVELTNLDNKPFDVYSSIIGALI